METASVFNPRNWNQTLRRRLLVGEPLTEEFLDVSTNPLGQGGLGSLLLGEVFQNEGNDVGLMLTLDSTHHAVEFGFRGFMLVAVNHFPRYPWTTHRGVDMVLKALYNFYDCISIDEGWKCHIFQDTTSLHDTCMSDDTYILYHLYLPIQYLDIAMHTTISTIMI